jgi:hypothetical protein
LPRFDARLRKLEAALAGRTDERSYESTSHAYREFEARSREYVERAARVLPEGWRLVTDRFVHDRGGICGNLLRASVAAEPDQAWLVGLPRLELIGVSGLSGDTPQGILERFQRAKKRALCLQRAWLSEEGLEVLRNWTRRVLAAEPDRQDLYIAYAMGSGCWWDRDAWVWRLLDDKRYGISKPWIDERRGGPR